MIHTEERKMLKRGDGAALTACSDGLSPNRQKEVKELIDYLKGLGLRPRIFGELFSKNGEAEAAGAKARAEALNEAYRASDIRAVFDLSGGDLANEILPYIDMAALKADPKPLWGYSDLTCVLNAAAAKAGVPSVLWQARNLAGACAGLQREAFEAFLNGDAAPLFELPVRRIRGELPDAPAVGGNCRCLLKLAGTPYWPDFTGRLLVLESLGGGEARIAAYFAQLRQTGAFDAASGLLLGTFTELERTAGPDAAVRLALRCCPSDLPAAKTDKVGHGPDAAAVLLGKAPVLVQEK